MLLMLCRCPMRDHRSSSIVDGPGRPDVSLPALHATAKPVIDDPLHVCIFMVCKQSTPYGSSTARG